MVSSLPPNHDTLVSCADYLFLNFSTVLLPVQPTALIFAYILIADLLGQLGSRATSDARLAIEDELFVGRGFREAELVLKLMRWHEQSIWS